ncbi:PREDICTED: Fanconi anemia group J protein-like [Habropoda laboriosa]|uniref:Fanconi anemia group J protein-like n=1 Tax=Habropoda laboriosa TaxID=597456 RepID=UPI00083D1BF0|nr:PREDICTED: Fanconi anemia group J protein-like [Habropoda laboriosa]
MSKLSLKRQDLRNEELECNNLSPIKLSSTIEISSDESDGSEVHKIRESGQEPVVSSTLNKNYSEETLLKFQKSTDSIQSDEDIGEPLFNTDSKPGTSMFNWNQQKKNFDRNIHTDSDSSDDSNQGLRWFQHKKDHKKHKSIHKTEPQSKGKLNKDPVPQVGIQHEQLISGIRVKLPVKPYSCQVAVMNKLIQGCVKKENCLLESPTGSGKTLALLCGVLAWHDHYVGPRTCVTQLKIPKIYYGTRTHKQIEQVVRELKKTCYKHKKMTILSSREHTCIQESTRNKTDLCNDLLDPTKRQSCPFYNDNNKKTISSFPAVENRGLNAVWDIEDLVAIGKNEGLCPYFAARSLMEHADIIFCPYNYIVDPDIRESIQLDLKDQVIILDEAHNIEDICREVASVTFREDHLASTAHECESLAKTRAADFSVYDTIKVYIQKLVKFLKNIGLEKHRDYNSDNLSSPYWTGAELQELFNMHELGESAYLTFLAASKAAIADLKKAKEENKMFLKTVKPVISPSTKIVIEHLMFAIRMVTSEQYMNDYRACVTETTVKDFKYATDNTWYSAKKQEHRARSLKLLCMNPGVIFSPLANNARSIILASGTLTPVLSFQSELNTPFVHVLNTGHVIPKEQVYATCVPKGPNGIYLKANYQNVNSWGFQDELGKMLVDVCESVPHGVLCFFSSYNVLHTQMDRWKSNFIWNRIASVKQVFIEPRYSGDLTAIMKEYREVIEETSSGPRGKINGALLLAVFRGKVAEGIDFKDDEARCVVTVGIPYGVRKDPVIDMKLKYNDMNVKRGLLRGSDWYSIQAFRALNQALGRCLRHIHDWGAVLLVDERFLQSENKENLPKWVKTMWIRHNEYNLREDLRKFVAKQKAKGRKE